MSTEKFKIEIDSIAGYVERNQINFIDPSGVRWKISPSHNGIGFDLRAESGDTLAVASCSANRVQVMTLEVVSGSPIKKSHS